MAQKDYYETLGVSRTASDEEIKKAYRRLAMKFHPDRHPDENRAKMEDKFKEVQEAYDVLRDSRKREAYNQFGHAGVSGAAGGAGAGPGGFGGFEGFADFGEAFGDIFSDIFGGARGGRRGGGQRYQGADLRYGLELTLEQAVLGANINVQVPTFVSCDTCHGSGVKKGSQAQTCGTCGGVGQVRMQQGFFSIQQTCPDCRGQGQVITDPCATCRGQGRVQHERKLSVKVPAGVDDGDRIRLSGEGEAGLHGAPAGDLYVQINVKKHPIFQRDESDLYCEIPISFITAAIGGEIEVPTLTGRVKLKVMPETQSGRLYRLRNKGVKSVHGGPTGDLLCRVLIETPVNLSAEQKKTLHDFGETLDRDKKKHNPQTNSWLAQLKIFFGEMKH